MDAATQERFIQAFREFLEGSQTAWAVLAGEMQQRAIIATIVFFLLGIPLFVICANYCQAGKSYEKKTSNDDTATWYWTISVVTGVSGFILAIMGACSAMNVTSPNIALIKELFGK